MNGMTSALTRGQKRLALIIIILAAADMPVFFSVMWRTVTALVAPSFGWQAWTVPLATELTFTVMFLLAVLFEWCRIPARWLWLAPFPFAAASFALNVAGAHGSIPGAIGHGVVTLAFFLPLLVAKTAVRRLLVTDEERARALALADAKAHARDMLRSALGIGWQFRAPVLLRRQLRSGRLPAKVLEAVESGARFGGATAWEPAVETWIAAAVAIPERTAEVLRAARAEASAHVPASVPETVPEAAPSARSQASAKPARMPALKLTAARSRGMSPDRLAQHVSAMLDAYGDAVSVNRVKADLSVGTEKAKAALEIARRDRARVVPIGERKQA